MPKKLPEYNASSLADIAFMLLIFFLVTTTMDTDMGIATQLPPMPEKNIETPPKIRERNVFVVLINKHDQLLVEGKLMRIENLKDEAKEFIANPNREEHLPEFKIKNVDIFGEMEVSKQVISLQNDRGTSYGKYIEVQNELVRAYNELRNEFSIQKFGKSYEDLEKDQQKAIRQVYPKSISEAEPKNYGGK